MPTKAVLDIGGTTTRIGLSNDGQTFFTVEKFPTEQNFFKAIEKIIPFLKDKQINSLVIGIAGQIDKKEGRLICLPHLSDWNNKKIIEIFKDRLTVQQIFLENDAILAGLAEANQEDKKKYSVVAYLTIGTGVGGARIINGGIGDSKGFEPGHQIIVSNGKEWAYCGQKGCLEAYISGTAWGLSNIFNDDYYQKLTQGLVNICVLWSPEAIILGGGLSDHLSVEEIEKRLVEQLKIFSPPLIFKRVLGDGGGLYGGLLYKS